MISVPGRFRNISITRKNLLPLLFAFLIFLSVPLTVFVALNVRDNRSKAETVPYAVLEPGLKKIDLTFSPDNEKLSLKGKTKESRQPRKENPKKEKADTKVLSIKVEQFNEFDKSIYNFVQDVEVAVDKNGNFQKKDVNFSVDIPDKPGKTVFSLGDKVLLEVPL